MHDGDVALDRGGPRRDVLHHRERLVVQLERNVVSIRALVRVAEVREQGRHALRLRTRGDAGPRGVPRLDRILRAPGPEVGLSERIEDGAPVHPGELGWRTVAQRLEDL